MSTADTTRSIATADARADHPDRAVIDACNRAIALFDKVRDWDGDDAGMGALSAPAHALAQQAMAMPVTALAGARAQIALLLAHYQDIGGPDCPDIELPPLHNLLRLLPEA